MHIVSLLLISSCMMKLLLSSRALSVKLKSGFFSFAKIMVFCFVSCQILPSIISLLVAVIMYTLSTIVVYLVIYV